MTTRHLQHRPLTPAAGGFPECVRGVTVRPMGEERPAVRKPRNLLELAAQCDNRDVAASAIMAALMIEQKDVCLANLPDAAYWRKLPPTARLKELAGWLYSECFELMDFVQFDMPKNMTHGD